MWEVKNTANGSFTVNEFSFVYQQDSGGGLPHSFLATMGKIDKKFAHGS